MNENRRTLEEQLKDFATAYKEKLQFSGQNPYDRREEPEKRQEWNKAKNRTEDSYNKISLEVGKTIANSIINKINDPTKHNSRESTATATATEKNGQNIIVYSYGDSATAVNSGYNTAVLERKRMMYTAFETLQKEKNLAVDFDDWTEDSKSDNLEDGLDLVNTAVLALCEQADRQLQAGEDIDFVRPYTVRRLKRKVYIKEVDSLGGYETVETKPIIEVYRAVRRVIDSEKSVKFDPKNGYTYLEDYYKDSDSDTTTTVYRRLPKYADIGGHSTDSDSDSELISSIVNSYGDSATVEDVDRIIAELNLTARQLEVLTLRLRGYGHKAISTKFGVTQRAIAKTTEQIRQKWIASGRKSPDSDSEK